MSFRRFFSTGADNLSACLRTRPCIVTWSISVQRITVHWNK
jgi:hypothetical protein